MTKEQIEKYQKIENEIQPLKNLMGWCGDKYKIPGTFLLRMYLTKIWMCIPVILRDKLMTMHTILLLSRKNCKLKSLR